MKLQTQIPLDSERNQISYDSKVLLMGSCFSENIGEKLEYFKFQNLRNPFGIIFNPVSIHRLVERALTNELFTEANIFQKEESWHCFEVHSLVSAGTKEDFLVLLNDKLKAFKGYVSSASHIILTYGSSWVYRHSRSSEIVANCHKFPQQEFTKELLSVAEVSNSIEKMVASIRDVNKDTTIITTLSPVRHLRDGFVENARSKAHLLSGLHTVDATSYFPSFELMMDELRDYRFYKQDLLHPNETAIEIIWERFKSVWVASETESLQKRNRYYSKGFVT